MWYLQSGSGLKGQKKRVSIWYSRYDRAATGDCGMLPACEMHVKAIKHKFFIRASLQVNGCRDSLCRASLLMCITISYHNSSLIRTYVHPHTNRPRGSCFMATSNKNRHDEVHWYIVHFVPEDDWRAAFCKGCMPNVLMFQSCKQAVRWLTEISCQPPHVARTT